jgi:hypothetical protein
MVVAIVNSSAGLSAPKVKGGSWPVQTWEWHMPSNGNSVLNVTSQVMPSTYDLRSTGRISCIQVKTWESRLGMWLSSRGLS